MGKQVADAGVGLALLRLLKQAGARDDIESGDILSSPLWNHGRATAEALLRCGVKMALRQAAALGKTDARAALPAVRNDQAALEAALIYACSQGEIKSARILMQHGAKGDCLVKAIDPGMPHATALHVRRLEQAAGTRPASARRRSARLKPSRPAAARPRIGRNTRSARRSPALGGA